MNTGRCALAVAAVIGVYFATGLPGCGGGLGGANPSDGGGESGPGSGVDASAMANDTGASVSYADASDGTAPPPACTWPASPDDTDAAAPQCRPGRTVLSCGSEHCISNDPTQCPPLPCLNCGGPSPCQAQCTPGEYAVGCFGQGVAPTCNLQAPAACRGVFSFPEGVFFCCPLASDGGPTDAGAGELALADCAAPARSDAPTPNPEAYVYAQLGPETTGAQQCGFSSDQLIVEIGSSTSPLPVTMANGGSEVGNLITIACSVDPSCGGFDLSLHASLGGSGDLSFVGHIGPLGGSGLSGTFSTMGTTFSDSNCTMTLQYNGAPLPAGGAPAQGRIWGHIDCPNATEPGSAGQPARTCDGFTDFLFENCL